jgi:hypothetical protein
VKPSSWLGLVLLITAVGCGKSEPSAPTTTTNAAAAPGNNPLTAPVDYLGAVSKAKKVSEATIDTVSLNQAVQLFNAQEGRYPKDLNELVTEQYLPRIPEAPYGTKLTYDPAKGEVRVVKAQ